MTWIDRLKETLPVVSEDTASLGLAIGIGVAGMLMVAFCPVVLAVGIAAVAITGLCAAASGRRKNRTSAESLDPWQNPACRTAAYFSLMQGPPDPCSSRFQDMVSSQEDQPSQGWER